MAEVKLTPADQEAMVRACNAGRLDDLQTLFDKHGIKNGSQAILYFEETPESPPITSNLFAAAISHGHQSIVRYLYSIYPILDISDGAVAEALLEPPLNVEMLKLVCSYSPEIVHFEYDDHMTSLLSKACEDGADNAPFIHVLLDHGALNNGMQNSYTYRFGAALLPALEFDQPIDIISKMVPKTRYLAFAIRSALMRKRADALEVLLNEERTRDQASSTSLSEARSWLVGAEQTGDEDAIDVLERYIKSKERQVAKSARRDLQVTRKEAKRWWLFGTRAETQGVTRDQSSTSKSWWPLSKNGNRLESHDTKQVDDASSDEDTGKDG